MRRPTVAWFVPVLLTVSIVSFVAGMQERHLSAATPRLDTPYSYAGVVQRVMPSMVSIYATKAAVTADTNSGTREAPSTLPEPDTGFRRRVPLHDGGQSAAPEDGAVSVGSGVIIDRAGLIVTASHVIADADRINVVASDEKQYPAKVVFNDVKADLAFLRLTDSSMPIRAIELGNSDALRVGDTVLALGNPFGVGLTVTHGIISALGRVEKSISEREVFIQTDAAINPGNSGGALVDLNGRLIGISTAIVSQSGGSEGVGFAIPVNVVRTKIQQAQ